MLLFWWAGSLASRMLTTTFVYQRLSEVATALVSAIEVGPALDSATSARLRLDNIRLSPVYNRPASGQFYMVQSGSRPEILSRSAWEFAIDLPTLAPGQQQRMRLRGLGGEPLLMWLGGFAKDGEQFTVAVAEDFGPIASRLRVFEICFAVIALLVIAAVMGVLHVIMRRSVEQLEAIREDMHRLEQGQAKGLTEDVPNEVLPLVREFNRLLRRFDQRLRLSRNAVGNLAHALKGPLNLLMHSSQVDVDPATQRFVVAQNAERIHQIIDSELKRARLAGRSAVGQRFDLDAELPPLIGLLKQVYSEKEVDVRFVIGPHVELNFDRQDMLELIGNLVDNAVKWAKSAVMVSVREADGVMIVVEDDGPGCPPEQLRYLTERGVRLDESVAGYGLGLSIVKDIVDSYNGELRFDESTRFGGLMAVAVLPERG